MSATPTPRQAHRSPSLPVRAVEAVGRTTAGLLGRNRAFVRYLGGMTYLAGDTLSWIARGFVTPSARVKRARSVKSVVALAVADRMPTDRVELMVKPTRGIITLVVKPSDDFRLNRPSLPAFTVRRRR